MNETKVFIDTDLWYIPDFLRQEELDYLQPFLDDPHGWYITSRSKSIRNKFVTVKTKLHPEGTICPTRGIDLSNTSKFPEEDDERTHPIEFYDIENGCFARMEKALPKQLNHDLTLQSFWPLNEHEGGGAYNWHFEKGMSLKSGANDFNDFGMTAAWSIYLNDDFEGGVLEFLYKPYKIYPQKGMFISIPMTEDFTHRVTPVTKGIRHTMYGVCYLDREDRSISSGETC